jgi:hypothetical protein
MSSRNSILLIGDTKMAQISDILFAIETNNSLIAKAADQAAKALDDVIKVLKHLQGILSQSPATSGDKELQQVNEALVAQQQKLSSILETQGKISETAVASMPTITTPNSPIPPTEDTPVDSDIAIDDVLAASLDEDFPISVGQTSENFALDGALTVDLEVTEAIEDSEE